MRITFEYGDGIIITSIADLLDNQSSSRVNNVPFSISARHDADDTILTARIGSSSFEIDIANLTTAFTGNVRGVAFSIYASNASNASNANSQPPPYPYDEDDEDEDEDEDDAGDANDAGDAGDADDANDAGNDEDDEDDDGYSEPPALRQCQFDGETRCTTMCEASVRTDRDFPGYHIWLCDEHWDDANCVDPYELPTDPILNLTDCRYELVRRTRQTGPYMELTFPSINPDFLQCHAVINGQQCSIFHTREWINMYRGSTDPEARASPPYCSAHWALAESWLAIQRAAHDRVLCREAEDYGYC